MSNEPLRTDADCRLTRLRCRRTGSWATLAEHARCPFCFGTERELAQGRHEDFCDWKPERDPIAFGFPPDTERERRG